MSLNPYSCGALKLSLLLTFRNQIWSLHLFSKIESSCISLRESRVWLSTNEFSNVQSISIFSIYLHKFIPKSESSFANVQTVDVKKFSSFCNNFHEMILDFFTHKLTRNKLNIRKLLGAFTISLTLPALHTH